MLFCFSLTTIPASATEVTVKTTETIVSENARTTYLLNKNGTIPANSGTFQLTFQVPSRNTYTITATAGALNGNQSIQFSLQNSSGEFYIFAGLNYNTTKTPLQERHVLPAGTYTVSFVSLSSSAAYYAISVHQTYG